MLSDTLMLGLQSECWDKLHSDIWKSFWMTILQSCVKYLFSSPSIQSQSATDRLPALIILLGGASEIVFKQFRFMMG